LKKIASKTPNPEAYFQETMLRIKGDTDLGAGVKHSDIVIEAIIENLEKKQQLFKFLAERAHKDTIFTSNTSSFSIAKIASVTKRLQLFAGLHFFNPVPVMKLLEVVKTDKTSQETIAKLQDFGKKIGKTVITCKDTPGFVVNRLLVPYMNESVKLYERGVSTPQEIDLAMKLACGYPMGPFELADFGGLDTAYYILDGWSKQNPNEPIFEPAKKLRQLVDEKKFGRKNGEGFYKYDK